MSAKNLAYVLKKSPHKFFREIYMLNILLPLRLLEQVWKKWQPRFALFNERKSMKSKNTLPRDKKDLLLCHISVIQLAQKTLLVVRGCSVALWCLLMKMFRFGMNGIFLIPVQSE